MSKIKHRFVILDIFRGIFASFVVFYHMSAFSNTAILNNKFITHADVFVDFFFVLSGFVVCYSYQTINSAKELKTFLFKRIRRLYPLHLVLLLLFLFLELTKLVLYRYVAINNTLDNSTITFFTSLFLVNSIKFPGVNDLSWNMVSWSISAELISYIVFAFSCFFVAKLKLERFKIFFYAILSLVPFLVLY
ncbi:MAG: acyltransferase, partial [Pedobacter sp.]